MSNNSESDEDVDDKFLQDTAVIGKAILASVRKLSVEQNRPVHEFVGELIQAMLAAGRIMLEDYPEITNLPSRSKSLI